VHRRDPLSPAGQRRWVVSSAETQHAPHRDAGSIARIGAVALETPAIVTTTSRLLPIVSGRR
jgi:hypothetical protein